MYAYDFEYDGKRLSEFGFMICSFDDKGGVDTDESGSVISFNLAPMQAGRRFVSGGSKYESCLSTTFQICKRPYFFTEAEMEITEDEFRALSRWLNRREFLWFHASDWCDPEKARAWVRASFSLSRIQVDGVTYGIELEMTTDSPFCYGEEITKEFVFAEAGDSAEFIDENDEIGDTFPTLSILCQGSGMLALEDDRTGCECSVADCVNGEVISFSGDTMIVTTSSPTHDIANDFNYDFFRFANTYDERKNVITASLPCTVTMRYRPIRRDTL